MANLLEIAGGKQALLQAAYASGIPAHSAGPVILRTARATFIAKASADAAHKMDAAYQVHVMFHGDRPQVPSSEDAVFADLQRAKSLASEADAWDERLVSEIQGVIAGFLEMSEAIPSKPGREHWTYPIWHEDIQSAGVRRKLAAELAEHIWRQTIEIKDTVGKQLAALGIVQQEIDEFWVAADANVSTILEPHKGESNATPQSPQPIPHQAEASGQEPLPLLAAPPSQQAAPSVPKPAVKGQRGRKRVNAALTLPGAVFTVLRDAGITAKEVHKSTGFAISTFNRVASGEQTEVGVTREEFGKLLALAKRKLNELNEAVQTLGLWETAA